MDEKVEGGADGRRALGARMRTLRRQAGLRQADLAQRLGVTHRTIGSWEREGVPAGKVGAVDAALGVALGRKEPGNDDVNAALGPLAEMLDALHLRVEALEQRLAR